MNNVELLEAKISGKTYAEIAKGTGVSRQRIQQILSPSPVIRRFIKRKYKNRCAKCGVLIENFGHIHHKKMVEDFQNIDNLELLCISCHTKTHTPIPSVFKTCSYCEKSFHNGDLKARIRRNSSGLFFCSKTCQGKWLGYNHKPSETHKKKWDYTKVYELRDKTNWGACNISRELNIPESTVSKILKNRKVRACIVYNTPETRFNTTLFLS